MADRPLKKNPEAPPPELAELEEVKWECTEMEEQMLRSAHAAAQAGFGEARRDLAAAQAVANGARAKEVAAHAHLQGAIKLLSKARDVDEKRVAGWWTDPDGKVVRVRLKPGAVEAKKGAEA